MGDPKKIKKKYSTPSHPWQKARIEEEIVLKKEYGLKNKQEIWRMDSIIKGFTNQFKKLNAQRGPQVEKEMAQLMTRLQSLGLITKEDPLDKVLALETKDILERRLQTLVFKKKLARSIGQARQFIVHRHITINGKKITAPSYLVNVSEEDSIGFIPTSKLSDTNHPERFEEVSKEKEIKKKESPKKEDEEVVAFDEVPEDEEAIVKEIKKKESPKKEDEVEAMEAEKSPAEEKTEGKVEKEPKKESKESPEKKSSEKEEVEDKK